MYISDSDLLNNPTQIPQLRIVVTSRCLHSCIYCRPGGETFPVPFFNEMTPKQIALCTERLVEKGVNEIKITGGEPLLRNDIFEIIGLLNKLKIQHLELITRYIKDKEQLSRLLSSEINILNFSLDTVSLPQWKQIMGNDNLLNYLNFIEIAAKKKKIKINTVILRGINDNISDVNNLITYLQNMGGGTIKFLDYISDIPEYTPSENQLSSNLNFLVDYLEDKSLAYETITAAGGLGHPMKKIKLPGEIEILVKSADAGAFYGDICFSCSNYPCHDAIMALRLTPDGKLQRCLRRNDNLLDIQGEIFHGCEMTLVDKALDTYRTARFHTRNEILQLRQKAIDNEKI